MPWICKKIFKNCVEMVLTLSNFLYIYILYNFSTNVSNVIIKIVTVLILRISANCGIYYWFRAIFWVFMLLFVFDRIN